MAEDIKLTGAPQFDKLEIIQAGSITLNIPGGHSTTTNYGDSVTHGLDYLPIVLAFVEQPAAAAFRKQVPAQYTFYDATSGFYEIEAQLDMVVTSSQIVFNLNALASRTQYEGDWSVIYYILRERSNK